MPDNDDLFDGNDTDDLDDQSGGSQDDASAPGGNDAPAAASDSKRINDLMSKWQSAEAKATRLDAELARLKAQAPGPRNGGDRQAKPADEWADFHRSMVRDQLYASEPRFARYGIESTSIEGSTPAEMQASFARHKALVEKIETAARNQILSEHGLVPDLNSAPERGEPVDFARMSSKEFEEYLSKVGY